MKKAALFVAGLFFALTLTAQESKTTVAGNGNIIKEKRDISDFTKVSVSGPLTVTLTHDTTGKISLEGDENILAIITTEVTNGTLVITPKDGQHIKPSSTSKIKIKVPYALLNNIALSGCGTITSKGTVNSQKLKATVDGPGSIDILISSTEAEAWILGAGNINISGNAEKFTCKIVGSGTVMAYDLSAKEVRASISGSGEAKVNSTEILTGRITGTGNIAFDGEPGNTDLKYMGSGTYSWE